MSTISAVSTCTANMHVRATLRKYRVLRYLIWVLEENAANSVYLCVLRAHFSPVKCSENIFQPKANIRKYPQIPFRVRIL